ncbi:DgyrCDS12110 [Dimorphilus gyrociliatus]|uniref:DgyrCDS12110 n=1 Tax=Dimorphilus gyrociliatus TaxID=2664684 RepID=A0A7I8W5F9_9ANNE|nr:DgyrCDS12110 [Dimorphilus gyrociliatus]
MDRLIDILQEKDSTGSELLIDALEKLYPQHHFGISPLSSTHSVTTTDKVDREIKSKQSVISNKRDYDRLQKECEEAVSELNVLKTMLAEAATKREQALLERNHFSKLYEQSRLTQSELEKQLQILRNHNKQVTEQKEKLLSDYEHEIDLKVANEKEIDELREVVREMKSETTSISSNGSDALMKTYTTLCTKYDALRAENEMLKRQLQDTISDHKSSSKEICRLEDEKKRLWLKYESAVETRDNLTVEKSELTNRLESLSAERNQLSALFSKQANATSDANRQRDAAVHEYQNVMRERGIVLQESEEMQSKLQEAETKIIQLSNDIKKYESLANHLQRELETRKQENYVTKCQMIRMAENLKNELHIAVTEKKELVDQMNQIMHHAQKDDLIEQLKGRIKALEAEMRDQERQADRAKQRRDWAFSERDKIVLERDSMRTLCDQLRRDRDRAVSDLANAMGEVDQLNKHKSSTARELKSYKEKFQSMLRGNSVEVMKSMNAIHSTDLTLPTSFSETDMEIMNLTIPITSSDDFSFDLSKTETSKPFSIRLYDTKLPNQYILLRINDGTLNVNNINISNTTRRSAEETLKKAINSGNVNFVLKRNLNPSSIKDVRLQATNNQDFGLNFETGIFLSKISPSSPAGNSADLRSGDRLLSINGVSVNDLSIEKVETILETNQEIEITVQKYSECISSSHSITSTSGVTDMSPDSPAISPIANESWKKNQLSSCAQTETAIFLSSESDLDYGQQHFKRKKKDSKSKGRVEARRISAEEQQALEDFQSVIESLDNEGQSRGTWPRYMVEQRMRPTLESLNYATGSTSQRKDSFQRAPINTMDYTLNQPSDLSATLKKSSELSDHYRKNRLFNSLATSPSSSVPCPGLNSDQGATNIAVVSPQKKPIDTELMQNTSSLLFNKAHRNKTKKSVNRLNIPSKMSICSTTGECLDKGLSSSNTSSSSLNTPSINKQNFRVGTLRQINIEKKCANEQLGINIKKGSSGIIVSSVSQNSLASHAGIQCGDQLIEVCGINLRNATYENAKQVLVNCGNDVTIVVQSSAERILSTDGSSRDTISSESESSVETSHVKQCSLVSNTSTVVAEDYQKYSPVLCNQPSIPPTHAVNESRIVSWSKLATDPLGLTVSGGNNSGIFVKEVSTYCPAFKKDALRVGDRILEFNGMDMTAITRAKAHEHICKQSDKIIICAQYDIIKFRELESAKILADCLYFKMNFDRIAEDEGEMSLKRGNILLVDNTMYNGNVNIWTAWKLDSSGNRIQRGIIPAVSRLEAEYTAIRRGIGDDSEELKGSRRSLSSARRSFFRKKRRQRNNSQDSREIVSYSEGSLISESLSKLDAESGYLPALIPLKEIRILQKRPVVLMGPLADILTRKLSSENPDRYFRAEVVEEGQINGSLIYHSMKHPPYEIITLKSIQDAIERNRHPILHNKRSAIYNLYTLQIYPIVLLLRFRSTKQIQKAKDRFIESKIDKQQAKRWMDKAQKFELDLKQYISDIIEGESDLNSMAIKCKSAIDINQEKPLYLLLD